MQIVSDFSAIYLQAKHFSGKIPASYQRYEQKKHSESKLHYHNCLEIGCCESGNGLEMINNQFYAFSAGSVSVIPANCVHDAHIVSQNTACAQSIWKFIFVDTQALGLEGSDFSGFLTQDSRFAEIFRMLYDELEQKPDDYIVQFSTLLSAMLLYARRNAGGNVSKSTQGMPPEIAEVLDYINKHYQAELSVKALAKIAKQSESSFYRLFKDTCGQAPMSYVNDLRMNMASHLLKRTTMPIMDIAFEVGFHTLSSFNRLYKKHFGISPRQMRKS